jgi:hypothetical protein
MAETYWKSHICLSRILDPYISSAHQVEEFREMMHKTGAIISGSSVLQVFAWVHYDESDLDLYVEASRSQPVSSCLINLGYSRLETNIGMKEGLDPGDGYPGQTEIQHVETYGTDASNRIIQLINTLREPVFAILEFHSSKSLLFILQLNESKQNSPACVMNFVMHARAYSLYLYSTLCDKSTLVCGPTTSKIVDALKKYEERGWMIINNMTIDMMFLDPKSEWIMKYRTIGDELCWSRQIGLANHSWVRDELKLGSQLSGKRLRRISV